MRLRKEKKKAGKNPFEASMHIDNPDVKVVTASYKGQPFFIGVGISKQREVKGSGKAGFPEGFRGDYQSQKELDWRLLYNPNTLPPGFIPFEQTKALMAGTVAATSGNATVFSPSTEYKETEVKKLRKLENTLAMFKKYKDPETLYTVIIDADDLFEEKRKKKK